MSILETNPRSVQVMSYLIFALGAFGMGNYFVTNYLYSLPQNMAMVLGNGAITLLGVVGLMVARCLKNVEERLSRLENIRSAN